MQVSVESLGRLERRMTVAVPADRYEQEVAQRLKRLARKLKLPGFRPGKVPMKMVEAQYGVRVAQEAAGELIQQSFQEAVGSQGLRPAGGPRIEPKSLDRGKDLEYVATFEIYPDIPRLDIAGVRIERPRSEPQAVDVDRTLETMRRQRVEWKPVARPAQDDDRLTIDFRGTVDGEPFEGGETEGYQVVLGTGSLLEEFQSQLRGRVAGERLVITVTFPDDYGKPALTGKTAQFDVTVREVAEPELPELDAAFAVSFGVEEGGMERLRAEVMENLRRELDDRVRSLLRERVMDALLEVNDLDVPAQLLDAEIRHMIEANRAILAQSGGSPDFVPTDRSLYEEQAKRRVALGLILGEIARSADIKPGMQHVRATLERMAVSYENPEAYIKWHLDNPQRLAEVKSAALEEMLVEHLLEKAEVVDVPISFSELMYPPKATDK